MNAVPVGANWPRIALLVLLASYAAAIAIAGVPLRLILAAPLVLIPLVHWSVVSRCAWLNAFFVSVLLLPPLPVAFGNSGPHPAVFLPAVGVGVGFLRLREWRFERTFLSAVLLLVAVVLTLSAAVAALYSGIAIGAASMARAGLAAISVYVFFYISAGPARRTHFPMALIYAAAVASAAFACLDFYYQFPAPAGIGRQFVWLDSGVYRRAQGLFYEAGTLGNFCAFFLVMSAVALARRAGRRLVPLAGCAIFAAALIFSYSRASALNVCIALSALTFLERRRFTKRGIAAAAGIVVTGAVLAFAVFPGYVTAFWARLWASATGLFFSSDVVLSGRLESWGALLQFLAANPWHAVLGVGYKTLPYSNFIGQTVVADNMYLSMLVETGIVGLGALLALNLAILRAAWRAAKSPDPEKAFFGAGIFCFWMGQMAQMFSADVLTFWRLLPLYFAALALAVRR